MNKSLIAVLVIVLFLFAFSGCSTTVEYTQSTEYDGAWSYLENDDGTITLYGYNKRDSVVTIPQTVDGKTVSALGEKIFVCINDGSEKKNLKGVYEDNDYLEKVIINANIKEIPNMAFYICRKLKEIQLNEGLEKIGDFAFYGCESLKEVILPESFNSIGAYSFRDCTSLSKVIINSTANDVIAIGDKAFYIINESSDDDDQYEIIKGLTIIVKDISLYNSTDLEQKRRETKNYTYKYWQEYIDAGIVAEVKSNE